jgi:hypothetical protein
MKIINNIKKHYLQYEIKYYLSLITLLVIGIITIFILIIIKKKKINN